MRQRLFLLVPLLAFSCVPSLTRAGESPWVLHYDRPADKWVEALPVGNGRLGAMVFGGITEERLQLNEQNVWTGGPHSYAHPDAYKSLPEIRRLLFAGEQRAAEELATAEFMSQPLRQQAYQPMTDLNIKIANLALAGTSQYRRELNLQDAVATTTFTSAGVRYTRRVLASHPDQVVAIHLKCDQPGKLTFTAGLTSPHDRVQTESLNRSSLILEGQVNDAVTTPGKVTNGRVRFAVGLAVVGTDGLVESSENALRVTDATSATLLVAAETNVKDFQHLTADPRLECLEDLRAAAAQSFEELSKRHTADHRALFDRITFSLADNGREQKRSRSTDQRLIEAKSTPDPDLAALLFHYGRYLLIACSREGGQPANLQGMWNEHLSPAWGSKYTSNINAEMNYWLAEPCGLGECHKPLFDAIEELAQTGHEVAREHYDAPGWVLHHNFDRWRGTAPINAANHGIWPSGGAWLCQHLWEHYLFTGDDAFLRETAYPLMKGSAEFFADYLVEDPRPGNDWLVSGPSNSPEQGGLVMGPTMDHQIIRELFATTIVAAKTLGVDSDLREQLTQLRSRIAPNQVGRFGQLQEWLEDIDDPDSRHRHVSHLWGLHPGSEITPETPKLFEAARRSLESRGDGGTGWSRAWKANFWARLRDGDRAHAVLDGLMTLTGSSKTSYNGGGLYPNLFDAHPPFQIDGNFGAAAGMVEMLFQSHRRTDAGERLLELLPALPSAWPEGELRGIRGRDGFEVDLTWRDGQLTRATIHSRLGKKAVVVYGSKRFRIPADAGASIKLNQQLKLIDTPTNGG